MCQSDSVNWVSMLEQGFHTFSSSSQAIQLGVFLGKCQTNQEHVPQQGWHDNVPRGIHFKTKFLPPFTWKRRRVFFCSVLFSSVSLNYSYYTSDQSNKKCTLGCWWGFLYVYTADRLEISGLISKPQKQDSFQTKKNPNF